MTINVSINGKKLFDWTGNTDDVQNIDNEMGKMAAIAESTPEQLAHSVVAHVVRAGGFFSETRGEMLPLTWLLLSRPTEHPDHPGFCRDYIEAWDFEFDIRDNADDPKRFHIAFTANIGCATT
jgi:hypothetical protein